MGRSLSADRAIFSVPDIYVSSYYETGSKAATARQKSTTRKTVRLLWVRRAAEEACHAGDQSLSDALGRGRKSKVKALR